MNTPEDRARNNLAGAPAGQPLGIERARAILSALDSHRKEKPEMNRFIRSQFSSRPASGAEVMRRLGLDPKAHLPKEGVPRGRNVLDGFEVWVTPASEKGKHKSSKHRVLAMCPVCRKILSAGRLQQHMPIHKEEAR